MELLLEIESDLWTRRILYSFFMFVPACVCVMLQIADANNCNCSGSSALFLSLVALTMSNVSTFPVF